MSDGSLRSVHVVVPGDIDDDAVPSGGNVYDRRICRGLPATGRPVREFAVAGAWPRPDRAARAPLAPGTDGATRLLCVGAVTATKGQDLLVEALAAAADLLVLPSRVESYGMVVTEALARGIPVLAAAVGGVPETLGRDPDGRVPGIVAPPADVPALAAALRRWLGSPALREQLRSVAHEQRNRLDGWEATFRCLTGVLDRLPGTPG
jgi:glycosyltransferase involved in cell wall biosynthesis